MNRIMKKTAAAVLSVAMLASSAAALNQSGVQNGLTITASAANNLPPGAINAGTYSCFSYWEFSNSVVIYGCSGNPTTVYIPEKINNKPVTDILSGTFTGKTALKNVTFYAKIRFLSSETFSGCTNLTSVVLPNSLETIGWNTFNGCSKLAKIHIPFNTTSVERGAFAGCTALKLIIAHGNTSFDNDVFKSMFSSTATPFTGKIYCYQNTLPASFALNKGYNRVFFKMGDVNNDNVINATDASQILGFYASLSTGGNIPAAQREKMEICADVDRDGRINAVDASAVLGYYAALSTGYTYSFEYYMANR